VTTLEVYCNDTGIDPCAAMDALQGAGVVSDNCVRLADVDGKDQWRAINFLQKNKPAKTK
jgi:hypothetical protein